MCAGLRCRTICSAALALAMQNAGVTKAARVAMEIHDSKRVARMGGLSVEARKEDPGKAALPCRTVQTQDAEHKNALAFVTTPC
ncbi:hypothetical protein CS8_062740 [Cupriavidus sp. 8B]